MSGSCSLPVDLEAGLVANVSFRVRCEPLGYGEEVFLVPDEPLGMEKKVPLYTTAAQFPWYKTVSPLALTLPARNVHGSPRKEIQFNYRYAIHRAGVFYRWENLQDSPKEIVQDDLDPTAPPPPPPPPPPGSSATASHGPSNNIPTPPLAAHSLHLHLLTNRESYIVSNVLGSIQSASDVEHVPAPTRPVYTKADTLHSRSASALDTAAAVAASQLLTASPKPMSSSAVGSAASTPNASSHHRKKSVGFSPWQQPHYHAAGAAPPSTPRQAVHLNSTDGLVVVSIFLPVLVHRTEQQPAQGGGAPVARWVAEWDYEMLLSMQTHLRVTRVGVVRIPPGMANIPRKERPLIEECLRAFHCVPVWIENQLFSEMYGGFCKGVLWPVLHNVTSVYSQKSDDDDGDTVVAGNQQRGEYDSQFSEYSRDDIEQGPLHGGRGHEAQLWGAYNTVNRLFAERVVQCFNEGDLVWIHGFHLLILPSYLTRRIPMAKVGIFLHTPFPSSEIFRTVWCREDLLRGMLNADQVGFHLFEYARHFLTSCRRLLGLNYGMIPDSSGGHTLAIDTNGRHVVITSIHAGVEPPILNQILMHPSTLEKAKSIRDRYKGKTIICGIDRLESLKGIPLKLLGLERFLQRRPEWVGRIVLIQVGISAPERGDDYNTAKAEISKLVQKINGIWPGTVQFQECQESEMRLQQRMALLRASDVMVLTTIRDGLNLFPLEFTIAHQDALKESVPPGVTARRRGMCILSEFSSCTRVMRGALHINPWKISEIANAFHQALNMSEEERLRRISIASEFVTRVTTQRWALAVMLDLKGVNKNLNPANYSGAGLGLGYRLLGMDMGFLSLDTNVVVKAYKNSRARLILMDYGGTIVNNDNLDNLTRFQMVKERSAPSEPTEHMLQVITELCEDKRNTVFVVSGKERHSLTKSLGCIPNLGLAAEHGMFISWPTSKAKTKRRWETLVPETDRSWRTLAMSIMEVYASRTHGSYIEETEMKVLWQYRDADTEFGSLQAKELEDHLSKYLRSFPVDILHGGVKEGGYVEVRPKGVNKGVLAMRVMKRFPDIAQKDRVDFALVLGDDHCDEPMLSVMRQVGRRIASARRALYGEDPLPDLSANIQLVDVSPCDQYVSPDLSVFTATVGKKPSAAANYLHDVDEVQELLESLVKVSTRDQRYYSSVDLRSYANTQLSSFDALSLSQHDQNSSPASLAMEFNGLAKSMSMGHQMHIATGPLETFRRSSLTVSANLNDFLSPIEDAEEEEDAVFF